MTQSSVRVRFAPSPTGTLHIGGARTALFNWLFTRAQKGTFILRIEDTDQTRYSKSAEETIMKDLKWMGLEWDEGPDREGECGPYRQSLRLDYYHKYASELVNKGAAYHCFCTPERMDEVRKVQKEKKLRPGYDRHCRDLPSDEVKANLENGMRHVIRLKTPVSGTTSFQDQLRGTIEYNNEELDDLVLLKSDRFPSYHLANVVDDHLMGITHVLRGDEWIPSTPKHTLIYAAFGWEMPVFVHLPVILAEGGGKLSKRKGALSVSDYKDMGYLPDTLVNFLALLGWNPGNDIEIMKRDSLIKSFSLERINSKSCAFDEKKLEWMNNQYIMNMSPELLFPAVKDVYNESGIGVQSFSDEYLGKVISLMQERTKRLTDFAKNGRYFFEDPLEYDAKAQKKHFSEGAADKLKKLASGLEEQEPFKAGVLEAYYHDLAESLGMPNAAKLIHPTRLAVSGLSFGPGLFELLELLGRDTVLRRLERAIEYLEE